MDTITVRAAINGVPVHAVIRVPRPTVNQRDLDERLLRRLHELEQMQADTQTRQGAA